MSVERDPNGDRLDARTRNDRVGGRQLAWLLGVLSLLTLALGVRIDSLAVSIGAGLTAALIAVLGVWWPHVLIRVAMMRWAELLPDDDRAPHELATRLQEGVPLEVAAVEATGIPSKTLAHIGIALMVMGSGACVLGCLYTAELSAWGFNPLEGPMIGSGTAFVGLLLWYRTL